MHQRHEILDVLNLQTPLREIFCFNLSQTHPVHSEDNGDPLPRPWQTVASNRQASRGKKRHL